MSIKWKAEATGLVALAADKVKWKNVAGDLQDWLDAASKVKISTKFVSAMSQLKTMLDVREKKHLNDNAQYIAAFIKKNPVSSFKADKAGGSADFQAQAKIMWDAAWNGPLDVELEEDSPKDIRYAFLDGFQILEMAAAINSGDLDELEDMYEDLEEGASDVLSAKTHKWLKSHID